MGTRTTAIGAMLWLAARVVYLVVDAAGIPVLRSLLFIASVTGIFLVLSPVLI